MNMDIRRSTEALSNRLLGMERTTFTRMDNVMSNSWPAMAREATQRWTRGRANNRELVINGLVERAQSAATGVRAEVARFYEAALAAAWSASVTEMKMAEALLEDRFSGAAGRALNRVERESVLVAARLEFLDSTSAGVNWWAGKVVARTGTGVREQQTAEVLVGGLLDDWGGLARALKSEARRVEFVAINELRTRTIQTMNEVLEES